MKITAIGIASLCLAAPAGVAAAGQATDVDYLRASRCRGIATGLGQDASAIGAYLTSASAGRAPAVLERGDQEFDKARRQARGESRTRLAAEYSSACAPYAQGQAAAR